MVYDYKSMTTLDQFVSTYYNQPVDVDHEYGAQCWDLVELYAEQVLDIPRSPWAITLGPEGAAYEAWTVFDAHMQQYFDPIPRGQQQAGDINVYGAHTGGPEGHINIQIENGQVFEQNADPDGSPSHVDVRPITYLLGSLRKKGAATVAIESDIVDQEIGTRLFNGWLHRYPKDQPELNNIIGMSLIDAMAWMDGQPERQRLDAILAEGLTPPTELQPGVYKVG